MCSNFLNHDFFEIFESETNDINSDLLSDDQLWGHDLLNLNSNEYNFDPLNEDSLYENTNEKGTVRSLDFDCSLAEFNHLLKDVSEGQQVKVEPTNSVSSTYLTDESSHPSSINSSPVSSKMRKRTHATFDSSSEKSYVIQNELLDLPAKASKIELVKSGQPTKIYKLTKDMKTKPIYINSVTIRQGSTTTPYVVHKLPAGVKTVNIRPQNYVPERPFDSINTNFIHSSHQSIPEHEREFLSEDFYNTEMDLYGDNKTHNNGYYQHTGYNSAGQSHNNKVVFQTAQQAGPLQLSEEEKRTLIAEGYSIPSRLPLTKQDERNLKKVRRKIKNKVSAQESRRKKKEYMDALEKKNEQLQRRNELLESTNLSLLSRNRHLEQQLLNKVTRPGNGSSTGLMLFMVCFALLFVGGSMPSSYSQLKLPQSSLASSSSLYYMGYGMSRSNVSDASQGPPPDVIWSYDLEKVKHGSAVGGGIVPRRATLLGDDHDDQRRPLEHLKQSCAQAPRDRWPCVLNNHSTVAI